MLFKNYLKLITFSYYVAVNSKEININQGFSDRISKNFVSIPPLNYCKYQQRDFYLENPTNGNINNEGIEILNEFPETSQILYMKEPSKYCKCHQKTIYFQDKDSKVSTEGVSLTTIENEEYFVNSFISKRGIRIPRSLREMLNKNNIQKFYNIEDVSSLNFLWRELSKSSFSYLNDFNKYHRYSHFLKYKQLSNKREFYNNYDVLKRKFPKDYNFLPDTYTSLEEIREVFKDYKVEKNNLWLVKPKFSSYGVGIRFLKNPKRVRKGDIVTKYISNPLLINKRKFDFRIYVLVTGHDPLKIYLNDQCFARMTTSDYDLNLDNLDDKFKHITNIHVQRKNKESNDSVVMSIDEVKKHIKEDYNVNFSDVWKDVKDIAIKSFIAVNSKELEAESEYKLASNNLFQIYGLDVIIDQDLKTWLIEINGHPSLSDKEVAPLNDQNIRDTLNIIGLVPFSHSTGLAMEGECEYKDSVDEAVQQSICEFTRPNGRFERIFPTKDNVDYYKQFFEKVTPNNQALWDEIKNNNFE